MHIDADTTRERFERRFGVAPAVIARAPGRVNLIGEHTDYNGGFVLPMAIEQSTYIAARPRNDGRVDVYSANLDRHATFLPADAHRSAAEPWSDFVAGVASELTKMALPAGGFDALVLGDVPMGSGLSSSASLEMACLRVFERLGGFELDGTEAARLGQRVENIFLGIPSGIMDQYVVRNARRGHALFLDCAMLIARHIPIGMSGSRFVIVDSRVARTLGESKYNARVQECVHAAHALAAFHGKPSGTNVSGFSMDELMECEGRLGPLAFARARHVISENARTRAACRALEAGDAVRMGELMNASHESLRNDYEVSCPELDLLVALGRAHPACVGSRLTGAGFGGCTVHLVESNQESTFAESICDAYFAQSGLRATVLSSVAREGASVDWV